MINHELATLDWRIHEFDAVVDDFVVVESVRTHSGNPREFLRPELDPRFASFAGRLHVTVIDAPPEGPDAWIRERSQREAIWTRGVSAISNDDDDLVIISDVDEVPFPEVVDRLARSDFEVPLRGQPHWFNFDWDTYLGPWPHASMLFYPAGVLRRLCDAGLSAEIGSCSVPGSEIMELVGWHASWFGPDEMLLDELASYSHARDVKDRLAAAEGAEGIRRRRSSGLDMYGERQKLSTLPRLPVHANRIAGGSLA
jgi:beta-1,4-mannosyl-glycoprotein beta-1,4-N-acetylglucosaminyltransferase